MIAKCVWEGCPGVVDSNGICNACSYKQAVPVATATPPAPVEEKRCTKCGAILDQDTATCKAPICRKKRLDWDAQQAASAATANDAGEEDDE